MTVKELIKKLEEFNPDLSVIYSTSEDNEEPDPTIIKHNFNSSYWTPNYQYKDIPANTPFVRL